MKSRVFTTSIGILSLMLVIALGGVLARAETIEQMNQRIENRKGSIEELEEKLSLYQSKIKSARKEAVSLRSQLAILEDEVEKNKIDIEITEQQIQKTNLEIQRINLSLDQTEKEIIREKKQLAEFLRNMYQNDQVTYLEVLVLNKSFSEFFDHYRYLESIQDDIRVSLGDIKNFKKEMDIQKATLEEKREREVELKGELEVKRSELDSVTNEKENLLVETSRSESKFQSYVNELKREQSAINNEIISLEKKIRQELERQKKEEKFKELGPVRLSWPIPGRDITAFFYDPDYPYRHIFEHPAVDIRSAQGTPLKAAEAGYVGQVKDGGAKGYSYIMIIHAEGISTVYGHVSAIYVKPEEYVKKGDIIGLTGGKPGTRGAGRLTTGAHLHFEVRRNGIPINPLDYLP